jgi:BirA family biotin operon repressor/biotin-[acetyl-CoA-carboxylase] ligase
MQLTIHHLPKVISTNITAKAYIALGAEEGTVIVADEQTGGLGRRGKVWQSPVGNLYCSLILKPPVALEPSYPELAMVAGVALQKALHEILPTLAITLKSPNDVLIDNQKLAGVLIEVEKDAVIVGIGININYAPEGLDQPTIKLNSYVSQPFSPQDFLPYLLKQFWHTYQEWLEKGLTPIKNTWGKYELTQ